MAYTNNIPAANDNISTSQSQIQGNFQFLADTTGNVQNPGFYKLPNGICIQWGTEFAVASGNQSKTFPIAYTTTYMVQISEINNSSGTKWISLNQGAGSGGFPWSATQFFYRVSASGQDIAWLAIGLL